MNKKINQISNFFRVEKLKNDKRIVVYLVCVLIATALWFLNALSKDYSTTISYPVKYVSAPKKQFLTNQPPARLDLKVNAHGFTLLRHKLNLSFSPIVLNISNITQDIAPAQNDYIVRTSSLIRKISDQISNEITVIAIQPDVLHFVLDSLKSKMVPVKPVVNYSFKPQYNLKYPVRIVPEMVQITGASEQIDTIEFIPTQTLTFNELDNDVSKPIDLLIPDNLSIKPSKVNLKIEVEKFTEKELNIQTQIKNKPENINIKLFPSQVKVTALVGLSEFEALIPSDFEFFVDYDTIKTAPKTLNIKTGQMPENVQILRITPKQVEYLIETN